MGKKIKVFAPATVANVGPGFDMLGFALEKPGDIVEIKEIDEPQIRIKLTEDNGLPTNPSKNTAGIGASETLRLLKLNVGLQLTLHKNMPLGSGLGSSGASAVAAAYGVNALFGNKLSRLELLEACTIAEKAACGSGHADNVAPSMLGGFTLIYSYNPLQIIQLPTPNNMVAVVVSPDFELKTSHSRAVLPTEVSLKSALSNCANLAAMVAAIYRNDVKLIGNSVSDHIVEPARASLIPGFTNVKKAALKSGAYGCSISGAGPSVFAITDDADLAAEIAKNMQDAFGNHGLKSTAYISKINDKGAHEING